MSKMVQNFLSTDGIPLPSSPTGGGAVFTTDSASASSKSPTLRSSTSRSGPPQGTASPGSSPQRRQLSPSTAVGDPSPAMIQSAGAGPLDHSVSAIAAAESNVSRTASTRTSTGALLPTTVVVPSSEMTTSKLTRNPLAGAGQQTPAFPTITTGTLESVSAKHHPPTTQELSSAALSGDRVLVDSAASTSEKPPTTATARATLSASSGRTSAAAPQRFSAVIDVLFAKHVALLSLLDWEQMSLLNHEFVQKSKKQKWLGIIVLRGLVLPRDRPRLWLRAARTGRLVEQMRSRLVLEDAKSGEDQPDGTSTSGIEVVPAETKRKASFNAADYGVLTPKMSKSSSGNKTPANSTSVMKTAATSTTSSAAEQDASATVCFSPAARTPSRLTAALSPISVRKAASPLSALTRTQIFEILQQQELPEHKETEIARDVCRTFPYLEDFSAPERKGRVLLHKVLRAASTAHPEIGYCQGMNFVGGVLLIHLQFDPSACFWVLLALIDHYDYYNLFSPNVPLLAYKSYQFTQIVGEQRHARLQRQLNKYGFSLDLFSHQWIMTLFSYVVDPLVCGFFWDAFLLRGWAALFAIGSGLLRLLKKPVEQVTSLEELSRVMHSQKSRVRDFLAKCVRRDMLLSQQQWLEGTSGGGSRKKAQHDTIKDETNKNLSSRSTAGGATGKDHTTNSIEYSKLVEELSVSTSKTGDDLATGGAFSGLEGSEEEEETHEKQEKRRENDDRFSSPASSRNGRQPRLENPFLTASSSMNGTKSDRSATVVTTFASGTSSSSHSNERSSNLAREVERVEVTPEQVVFVNSSSAPEDSSAVQITTLDFLQDETMVRRVQMVVAQHLYDHGLEVDLPKLRLVARKFLVQRFYAVLNGFSMVEHKIRVPVAPRRSGTPQSSGAKGVHEKEEKSKSTDGNSFSSQESTGKIAASLEKEASLPKAVETKNAEATVTTADHESQTSKKTISKNSAGYSRDESAPSTPPSANATTAKENYSTPSEQPPATPQFTISSKWEPRFEVLPEGFDYTDKMLRVDMRHFECSDQAGAPGSPVFKARRLRRPPVKLEDVQRQSKNVANKTPEEVAALKLIPGKDFFEKIEPDDADMNATASGCGGFTSLHNLLTNRYVLFRVADLLSCKQYLQKLQQQVEQDAIVLQTRLTSISHELATRQKQVRDLRVEFYQTEKDSAQKQREREVDELLDICKVLSSTSEGSSSQRNSNPPKEEPTSTSTSSQQTPNSRPAVPNKIPAVSPLLERHQVLQESVTLATQRERVTKEKYDQQLSKAQPLWDEISELEDQKQRFMRDLSAILDDADAEREALLSELWDRFGVVKNLIKG
ncbi:unnamed protein product [Amoebophrya sp. A120]|nr:unnamed protein product [Amoebophrya sp. A120]|eukprot:GSA120T00018864001.1